VTRFALPFRFLGFGVYWAWMTTFWTGTLRSPLWMPTVEQTTLARITVQAVTALSFLVAVLFARRLMSASGERLLMVGGAVLGCIGTVVATLGQDQTGGGAPVYLILAWVCLGVACAFITLLWGRFYATVGLQRASLYTPLSLVLAVVVGFVLSVMQPLAAIVVIALLPLVTVGMYVLVAQELPAPHEQQARSPRANAAPGHSQPYEVLWRIMVAIGVYGATLGFYLYSQGLFGEGGPPPSTGRIVALCVPLLTILLLQRSSFGLVFRITLPLTAAGFMLLPFLGMDAGWIGAAVVSAGGTLFDILMWIALSEIAHRGTLSSIRVFGLGRAANAGGIALGWAGSYLLLRTSGVEPTAVLAFSLGMVFILILTTTLIFKEGDFPAEEAVAGAALPAGADPDEPVTRPAAGRWRRCCATIAHEYSLSPREEEVMVLLAKGRSMKHIEDELVISYHTAKSHANHIYRKLGVHSREELIDMVENRTWPGSTSGPGPASEARPAAEAQAEAEAPSATEPESAAEALPVHHENAAAP